MSQSKSTPYYQELEAALAEAEALRVKAAEAKAKRVRALLAEGMPMREIARNLGIHHETVKKIRDGRWRA